MRYMLYCLSSLVLQYHRVPAVNWNKTTFCDFNTSEINLLTHMPLHFGDFDVPGNKQETDTNTCKVRILNSSDANMLSIRLLTNHVHTPKVTTTHL